jgi:nitrite reductase/ring-hydroxylating ferredoxin subunit/Fe-S cluster biogenesis protein NfuA
MSAEESEPTRRADLAGLVGDIDSLERIFAGWAIDHRHATEAYRRAIEALHGEALGRLIRALKTDPAALTALKAAACDEVVYAVLRRHGLLKPSLNERVETALQLIRPMLGAHGGDVEIVRIDPPRVELRFTGACDGCAASALTFQAGVRKAIQDACPEITNIVQVKGLGGDAGAHFVSPFTHAVQGRWIAACALHELPENGLRALEIGGQKVVLFRRGPAVTCFQNACAHLGLEIHAGAVDDGVVTCPHHGFRYDLVSGECLTTPEVRLHAHAVRVIDGRVDVRIAA